MPRARRSASDDGAAAPGSVAASSELRPRSSPTAGQRLEETNDDERSMTMALPKPGFLRVAWNLAWPYWTGEEKWSARGLLAAVVLLNLISVWLNVRLNAWNAHFYNALQEYDWPEFWWQFAIFGMIATALIVVAVYQLYLRQILQIRWRAWLTDRFLNDWLGHQTYYRMQLDQTATDNPDQRIADDIDRYTSHQPGAVDRADELGRHAVLVPVHPVDPVGHSQHPARRRTHIRHSGLHGVSPRFSMRRSAPG